MPTRFVITTIIQHKKHFISETIKIFTGQLVPGYSKKENDALVFEKEVEASNTIKNIRDLHHRKFEVEPISVSIHNRTFSSYIEAKQEQLN